MSRISNTAPPVEKTAARTGGKRVAPTPVRPFGAADAILLFLCGALLLLIFVAAALPCLMGLTSYTIASDSMTPTLSRGDMVFARQVAFEDLKGGEIVVFTAESGLITHRVYSVDERTRTLRTKADASPYLDVQPIEADMLVGQVVYKLPLLGYISLNSGGEEALS